MSVEYVGWWCPKCKRLLPLTLTGCRPCCFTTATLVTADELTRR